LSGDEYPSRRPVAILTLVFVYLAVLTLRRPVFFKLGLRPIPRRKAQSTLIVVGLMLATLIITAAFVTGDTLSNSIRTVAIEGMGEMDEVIQEPETGLASSYFKMTRYDTLSAQLAGYTLVDHLLPVIQESVPVVNATHRRSVRSLSILDCALKTWLCCPVRRSPTLSAK